MCRRCQLYDFLHLCMERQDQKTIGRLGQEILQTLWSIQPIEFGCIPVQVRSASADRKILRLGCRHMQSCGDVLLGDYQLYY